MSTVHRKTASTSSEEAQSPPPSPNQTRLIQKMAATNLGSPQNQTINWGKERVFSPGQAVGYKTPVGIEFVDGSVQLFHSGQDSQGLILDDDHVVGASVTTTITTKTARKKEKKGTFIQYDKTRVGQEGADFEVMAKNERGQVNYQGGHLIDHKYSAENSHTTERNYFPQHCMVNAPFKEYLVQQSDKFLEIPLYTPNSPTIGVSKQKGHTHKIPIGDIFVQIKQNRIHAVYYFPNNNFNYEGLKQRLGIKKDIAATMTPYFKLKPCFYPLFQPAVITKFGPAQEQKTEQSANEKAFIALMDEVTYGISLASCDADEEEIVRLAYSVVHENGTVDPSLLLDCNPTQWAQIKDEPLKDPFNTLGTFLVTYMIRNALKSEVMSIHSRLVFLSGLIDFIEAYTEVSDEALEFVDSLVKEFEGTFDELQRIKGTMNQEELFFFADIYSRISDYSNHAFSTFGHEIYFQETYEFFTDYINMLKFIASKYDIKTLKDDYASRFLAFIQSAQGSLDYWIETGFPREEFRNEGAFLSSMVKPCLSLFDQQNSKGRIASDTFQTNIHRTTTTRAQPNYIRSVLENLGLHGSDSDSESE